MIKSTNLTFGNHFVYLYLSLEARGWGYGEAPFRGAAPHPFLYATFDKKGTPFVHLPLKMVSLSHTNSKSSFHYMLKNSSKTK